MVNSLYFLNSAHNNLYVEHTLCERKTKRQNRPIDVLWQSNVRLDCSIIKEDGMQRRKCL